MTTPTTPEKPPPGSPARTMQVSTTIPQKNRKLVSSTQQNQDLASSRDALRKETCKADVIPIKQLLEAVYGKLEDAATIRACLEKEESLSDRGWRAFYILDRDSYQPSDSPFEEDKTFTGIAKVFEQCMHAAGITGPECIVQLEVHGHATMATNFPDETRPDATIHLTKSSYKWVRVRLDHEDVYLYMQFKKKKSPASFEDDVSKLLWNVHQRFRFDPCCRFVCGLTIKNTTARFWHFSRAAVMVSEPFDIMTNPDKLIHIFLSSARAKTPADLGFDPTITCITDHFEDERNYQITIHNNKDGNTDSTDGVQSCERTFTTKRTIANHRAAGIRSRGTWIFEAKEDQQPDAAPVVIKDVWIDSDREVEGTILENVREVLKDTPDDLQLFLEPLCHGCVLIDGIKDLTLPRLQSTKTVSFVYSGKAASLPSTSVSKHSGASEDPSIVSPPNIPSAEPVIIGHRGDGRKHYRIAFKGKPGRTLHDLENYHDIFAGLLGGVNGMFCAPQHLRDLPGSDLALRALHKAGYIHRDMSSGNVLILKGNEGEDRGVLIDLEYAKRFPDKNKQGHDARTGTLQFMAVEVNARAFLRLPEPLPPVSSFFSLATPEPSFYVTPTFFHNPIHDVESVWWIALWTFHHLKGGVDADLFTNGTLRNIIVMCPGIFRTRCPGLPSAVRMLLDRWLTFIRIKYAELEKLVSEDSHTSFNYDDVFDVAIKFIKAIADVLPKLADSSLGSGELTSMPSAVA